ncbi:unnamed protein product [Lymnaea stagnalis]|uniref:Ig-like domain-containing protein n=1 Tax=Lymnaea stagnalis TaxID=6523 RepID=A0AAV2HPD2_LYMST
MIYNKRYLVVCLLALASSKVISKKIPCAQTFNGKFVDISCHSNNAYPGSNCTWIHQKPSNRSLWYSFPFTERWRNTVTTTCTTSIKEPDVGTHTVVLSIASKTGGDEKEIGHVQYNIEAPSNLPNFQTRNGEIINSEIFLTDDEDVRLECYQYGGVPRVYNISIVCDMSKTHEPYSGYSEGNHGIWIKVNRAWDQTTCTCYTHHISTPNHFKKSMKIFAISPPKKLTCDYTFLGATTAQVTCTTTRVYPKAECKTHLRNSKSSKLVHHPSEHQPTLESGYFTTKCLSSFVLTNQLNYDVDVEMYPYLNNYNTYKTPAMKSARVLVTVEPPKQAPSLKILNGDLVGDALTVRDGDHITVHCSVTGGRPSVIRTQIDCGWRLYTNNGASATFSLRVNFSMHQRVCTCSARHVSEMYHLTTAFSLNVQTQTVINSLQFLPPPGHMTNEYTPGSQLTLWCNGTGNPKPKSDLIYVKESRQLDHADAKASQKTIRYYLKHSMTAICNNTGAYRCSVSNHLNTIESSQEIELKVNCRIHHCSSSDDLPGFGVQVGEDIHIILCVIAYQTPIKITLHADALEFSGNGSAEADARNYTVRFTDTDRTLSRGLVNVTMHNMAVGDLGMYSLRLTLPPHGPVEESILNFTLYAKGRPLCPYNLTLINQSHDNAILTWIPGFDGGLPQTFVIVLTTPNSSTPSPGLDDSVVVAHVPQTKNDFMEYNLTDLSNRTHSVVHVQPENAEGARQCPDANIALTQSAGSRDDLLWVIIYSASSVTLTALFMGVFIWALRKPQKRKTHFDAVEERSGVERKRGENIVQNSLSPENNFPENESINLYTKETLSSNKAGCPNKGGFMARKPAPAEGQIYANVKSLKPTREDDNPSQGIYNNPSQGIYNNPSQGIYNNPSQGIYNNLGHVMPSKTVAGPYQTNKVNFKNKVCNQVDGGQSGRTVSPGGLIYLSVVVDPKTEEAQIHKSQATLPRQRTEYMTLDLKATSRC